MRFVKMTVSTCIAVGLVIGGTLDAGAAQAVVVGHQASASDHGGTLNFELEDGSQLAIEFSDGSIVINGDRIGTYDLDGALLESWHQLIDQSLYLGPAELLSAANGWKDRSLQSVDVQIAEAFEVALAQVAIATADLEAATHAQEAYVQSVAAARTDMQEAAGAQRIELAELQHLAEMSRLAGLENLSQLGDLAQLGELGRLAALGEIARSGQAVGAGGQDFRFDIEDAVIRTGDYTVAAGEVIEGTLIVVGGDLAVRGHVTGSAIAIDGDVRLFPSARVDSDAVAVGGRVIGSHSLVGGSVRMLGGRPPVADIAPQPSASVASEVGRHLATFLGTLVALASIGFGLTFFAPKQLDVIATRVAQDPGRSFMAGLFAQPLILPVASMLVIALTISVVGIILVPFAIIAATLAVVAAAIAGYLAVAQNVGTRYLRQKKTQSSAVVITPYRATVRGLIFMTGIWIPAVLLGWIQIVGTTMIVAALAFTWVMVTAGFGAVLTTRAGTSDSLLGPRHRVAQQDEWASRYAQRTIAGSR